MNISELKFGQTVYDTDNGERGVYIGGFIIVWEDYGHMEYTTDDDLNITLEPPKRKVVKTFEAWVDKDNHRRILENSPVNRNVLMWFEPVSSERAVIKIKVTVETKE